MQIIPAFVTQNPLYQQYTRIQVRKLVLHSVGCPQPSAVVFARQWQTARYFAHAVLQADGTVYQVAPWDCIRYTGGATFVCSDRARAVAQVTGTYNTAVALFAQLCTQFGLDPNKDIISHAEASAMGIGTNHADPEHLWRQLGMGCTMDGFRRDVAEAIAKEDREEVPDMPRYDSVAEMPQWARADAQRLIDRGALQGNTDGKLDVSEDMLRTMIVCQRMVDEQKET